MIIKDQEMLMKSCAKTLWDMSCKSHKLKKKTELTNYKPCKTKQKTKIRFKITQNIRFFLK
jgi:hypothetical protein